FWRPSRMAITNDLPSVFCWVSQMANNHISSFIRYRRATGLDALCITCAGLVEASARAGDLKFHLLGVHKANKPTSLSAWLRWIKAAGGFCHCLDCRRPTALLS